MADGPQVISRDMAQMPLSGQGPAEPASGLANGHAGSSGKHEEVSQADTVADFRDKRAHGAA